MIAYQCTCGYAAASDGELGDHWGEVFIPPDDRDAAGIPHAEAARDAGAGGPGTGWARRPVAACVFACLCGDAFDHLGKLDEHLLTAFIPADRIGRDGRAHAPAA
jgi:hypothetical protein